MTEAKRKGTRFESEIVEYLRDMGFDACERRALSGNKDKGDIAGITDWTFECKHRGQGQIKSLSEMVKEGEVEAKNAETHYWSVILKRTRASVKDSYAIVPLWMLVELIRYSK